MTRTEQRRSIDHHRRLLTLSYVIDIWKEGDVYEIYDNMVPLKEYSSLSRAREAARAYATTGMIL